MADEKKTPMTPADLGRLYLESNLSEEEKLGSVTIPAMTQGVLEQFLLEARVKPQSGLLQPVLMALLIEELRGLRKDLREGLHKVQYAKK